MNRFKFWEKPKKIELENTNTHNDYRNENRNIQLFSGINTQDQDLSKPYVDDLNSSGSNFARFGEDNLYPNILNELFISSVMHSACVNFKTWSIMGDGYQLNGYDDLSVDKKIDMKFFERKSKFKSSIKRLTKDWIKHGRSIVILHYNKEIKKYDYFKAVDPANIRNNACSIFNDVSRYYYADNWERRMSSKVITPYSVGNTDEWQILEIKNIVGGLETYGIPDYVASTNWQSVSANLSLLHKSALENGIQPSVIFKFPFEFTEEEELIWQENMRDSFKGVKNHNRAMKVNGRGADMLPEIEVMKTSDNHQLFEQTSKEQKTEIAMSHNINPVLMGVSIPGSLGQNENIDFAADQFEKIWLNDNREILEDFINDIINICDFNVDFKFNKTEIKTYTEVQAELNKKNNNK